MGELPQPGDIFEGRYRLDRILGAGGFATVFVGTDVELQREVAIKILRPTSGRYDRRGAQRFLREAKVVAQLNHPHIVTMFDYGQTADGLMYSVFELVGGVDLSAMMSNGPLPEAVVIRVMSQVLEALHEAHEAGLLHRDVKPDNIRVYEYMGDPLRVKLLDFGIAKSDADDASLTATGRVVGTPQFMAPEALYSEPVGPPADLYGLGLVVYEMLVGAPSDHLRRLVNRQPVAIPPGTAVSSGLERVVNRMLERDVKDRYANAREVLAELRPIARETLEEPVATPPPRLGTTAEPVAAPIQGNAPPVARPPWAIVGVFAAGLGLGVLVMLAISRGDAPPEPIASVRLSNALVQPEANEIRVTPIESQEPAEAEADAPPQAVVDGCGGTAPRPGTRTMSVRDGLREIEFALHIPPGYDPDRPNPLVVLFHDDSGSSPTEVIDITALDEAADEHGFVVVAPVDNDVAYVFSEDGDLADTRFVVGETRTSYCIDADRIFLVGYGSGGWATEGLFCEDWVAGVATAAFVPERKKTLCDPVRPVPALVFLPSNTGWLPPDGSPDCLNNPKLSFDAYEKTWQQRNQSTAKAKVIAKKGRSRCQRWEGTAPFVSCRVDGGRRWFGAPARQIDVLQCDGPPTDFPYNPVLWDFFASVDVEK